MGAVSGLNPNEHEVGLTYAQRSCTRKTGVNYLTVRGFICRGDAMGPADGGTSGARGDKLEQGMDH